MGGGGGPSRVSYPMITLASVAYRDRTIPGARAGGLWVVGGGGADPQHPSIFPHRTHPQGIAVVVVAIETVRIVGGPTWSPMCLLGRALRPFVCAEPSCRDILDGRGGWTPY